ncbi:hypothetical protein C7T35_09755 [Variovorax sp. WS11]|uniref:four-carbon acid sugar kinase family protein n=1 Tax=Variovorax sp. WS11 TaxID=1105204 RepID=UPI000D0DDF14|nr:four-carbon acid sugar kinase family protein [Variovorax sp. WS11]PSL84903.1 hypothetical protein C7T35_09755 [Variovorax sp. WS11]
MSVAAPAILYYADDFTGATDTLATATRAGLRALLFLKQPDAARLARAGLLDCVGIAGAARAMNPDEMRAELRPVGELFETLGARVLHYKTCSTFDSAPEVGSIGAAARLLRRAVAQPWAAIVGGQPALGRYCLFGHLFASAGAGSEVHRIDRHPTMSRHPVTPMHESDLRRHLALQGLAEVRSLPYTAYGTPGGTHDALQALVDERPDAVLFDLADDSQLEALGAALWPRACERSLLAVGPSSVVQAVATQLAMRPQAPAAVAPARGPVLVLAGSLSPVTEGQMRAARSYEIVWLEPLQLVDGAGCAAVARRIADLLSSGLHVLACTRRPDAADDAVEARALARAGGALLAQVLALVPLARIGVAGGDTSSHAVQALDAWGLSYLAALGPGTALCRLHSDAPALDGMELMLKGGQMGGEDVFERLVHGAA